MPAFAAALSTHPVTAHATGEVIGQVTDRIGRYPDLAVLLATPGHAGALDDVAATVRALLGPTVLVGAASGGLLGPGGAVPGPPAMALWAGMVGPLRPLRLRGAPGGGAGTGAPFRPGGALVLGDHRTFDAAGWAAAFGGVALAGGTVAGEGPAHLVLDAAVLRDGAVGVVLGRASGLRVMVLPGTRPVGPAYVVTRAEGQMIYELSGRPAMTRVREVADDHVPAEHRALLGRALHLGVAAAGAGGTAPGAPGPAPEVEPPPAAGPSGRSPEDPPGRAPVVVRVLGADRANGAIAVPGGVGTGAVVRFHLPDADALAEEVRRAVPAGAAAAALAFASPAGLAGMAEPLAGSLERAAVVGVACASELGPPAGPAAARSEAASLALFGPGDAP